MRQMLSNARSNRELVAEPGTEPISRALVRCFLPPQPWNCSRAGVGSREQGPEARKCTRNVTSYVHPPWLWALGTCWLLQLQRSVPRVLSSLGCSSWGGEEQQLGCSMLRGQLAGAVPAWCLF